MTADGNIVKRLQQRIGEARRLGFHIRFEVLDEEQATWCIIGQVPTLFVDLSQGAGLQLRQIDDALQSYADHQADRAA